MRISILCRRTSFYLLKSPEQTESIGKPNLFGNLFDVHCGLGQQPFCVLDPNIMDPLHKAAPRLRLKNF